MNKKLIIEIIVVFMVAVVSVGGYFLINSNNNKINNTDKNESNSSLKNENTGNNNDNDNNSVTSTDKKTLVVYYSASGSTKKVAKKIAKNLNANLFEIEPVDSYTKDDLNWTDSNSRVTREHNDESLRDVQLKNTKVNNWNNYETILIGYPIWWGIAAWPVNNFVKDNDFTGKTVIPFCTSASSGLGNSAKLLEDLTKTGNWQEGYRFNSSAKDTDIKMFTDSIK